MTYKKNTAEGGSNTTAVTMGNSGGTSGDAASALPGTTAPTFSSTQAQAGTLSYAIQAASGSSCIWQWTGFNGSEARISYDFYCPGAPAATTELIHLRSSSAAQARVLITTAGKIQLNNFANSTEKLFSNALSVGWYRISVRARKGTGTGDGQLEIGYYASASPTTPVETVYLNNAANAGTNNFTDFRFGKLTTTAWTTTHYIDNLQADDSTAGVLLGTIATTPPTAADTAGDYYVVDLSTSTAGSGGTLSYATTKLSGQTLTNVQVGAIFYFVKSAVGTGTYRFTVSESPSGQTSTIDVVVPMSPGTTTVNKTAPAVPNHSSPSSVWS